MSVNFIKDPVMQRSDESAESDQSSTRSTCLNKLRKICLSMVFCSLLLIVVAFSKDQFLCGEMWNGDAEIMHQGMFQSCTTTTYGINSIVYECTHTFRNFWTSKTPNMWPIASGKLLTETLIQLALFYLMIRRPVLKNTRVVKYVLSFVFIVCSISGLIVVSVAGNVRDLMNGEHFVTRTVSWSWSWDVSMYLIFVAYPLSVVGYILYCVGWKLEVYPHLPQYNQVQGSYLPYGHGELTTSLPA